MKSFLLAVVLTSSFAQAGTCKMYYESNQAMSMRYQTMADEPIKNISLEECVELAERKLGTKVKRKSLVWNDEKIVTDTIFEYSDKEIKLSGRIELKNKKF